MVLIRRDSIYRQAQGLTFKRSALSSIKHEEKICPCCQTVFECKAGSILLCQCSTVQLTARERAFIESRYEDCLCATCLVGIQKEFREINKSKPG